MPIRVRGAPGLGLGTTARPNTIALVDPAEFSSNTTCLSSSTNPYHLGFYLY